VSEQTINFGFRPVERPPFAALWQRVLSNAENAPACPCHGIVAGQIDPDTIETNMLSPLRTTYRNEGLRDLSDFVERRLRKSPFAGLRQPLAGWLDGIPKASLTPQDRTRLEQDLVAALTYYATTQFNCD